MNFVTNAMIKDFNDKMKLIEFEERDNTEARHERMDILMCNVFDSLGFYEGIDIFRNTHKWYA